MAPGVGSDSGAETSLGTETSSNSLDIEDTSDHEKSLADKVSLAMGGVAVKAAGVRKPIDMNRVETNEPVRESVERDKTGVGSPALVMTKKEVLASIGAIKVNGAVGLPAVESVKKPAVKITGIKKPSETDKVGDNPADLVATEPVKKPVETDKTSADLVDLPAAKSVENPVVEKLMETNETNADILPESFKDAINRFKQLAEENNGKFFAKAQYITGELNQLRQQIQMNPAVIYRFTNKFKNDIESLLKSLKSNIENDDESRRLVKLTKYVERMGKDSVVLGNVTNGLLDKLIRIRSNIAESQSGSWGIDDYKSSITRVIDEIINDLSTASGRRRNIVGGIKGIESEGYYQER